RHQHHRATARPAGGARHSDPRRSRRAGELLPDGTPAAFAADPGRRHAGLVSPAPPDHFRRSRFWLTTPTRTRATRPTRARSPSIWTVVATRAGPDTGTMSPKPTVAKIVTV